MIEARRLMDNLDLHPPDDYSHRFFIWHEWIQVSSPENRDHKTLIP